MTKTFKHLYLIMNHVMHHVMYHVMDYVMDNLQFIQCDSLAWSQLTGNGMLAQFLGEGPSLFSSPFLSSLLCMLRQLSLGLALIFSTGRRLTPLLLCTIVQLDKMLHSTMLFW